MQSKIGHFESDGQEVHIPIGFEPDFILFIAMGSAGGNASFIFWFKQMGIHGADGTLYDGVSHIDGADARIAAGSGLAVYDTASELPDITQWVKETASMIARTSTAHGTYRKATVSGVDADGNEIDRSEVFECVNSGTTGTPEPIWPTVVGENGPSDNGVIWQKVNVATLRGGYKGFTVAGSLTNLADTDEGYFIAIQADSVEDYGDVVGWIGGVRGA